MPISDWVPSIGDIGSILRSRTKDAFGAELGTFTVNTRPTDAQVLDLIDLSTADVATIAGEDLDIEYHSRARYLTSLRTAMQIELTYFPEQVASGHSPYIQLKELYDEAYTRFETATAPVGGDGEPLPPGVEVVMPQFGFPPDGGGLIGWNTQW